MAVIKNEINVKSEKEKLLKFFRIFDKKITEMEIEIFSYLIEEGNESYILENEKDPKSIIKIIKVDHEKIIKNFSLKSLSTSYTAIKKLKEVKAIQELEGKKDIFSVGENLKKISGKSEVIIQTKISMEK